MGTVTTRVEWTGPHSVATATAINDMVEKMTESGKLISRSSPEADSSSAHSVTAVWIDLDAANEYLAVIDTLSPVSAAIV